MSSREFCYWLQGYFEIAGVKTPGVMPGTGCPLTVEQTDIIARHLSMVFVHEIDPSYPNQAKLNTIHNPGGKDTLVRC